MQDTVYTNCRVATMAKEAAHYGLIKHAAIAVSGGRIHWVGPAANLPDTFENYVSKDLHGRLVSPALIDCHTHIVFGGNRALEFEKRLNGISYAEISRQGGGIRSTVMETRKASFDALVTSALKRVDALIAEGVAILEIKSGYGLTIEDEIRMLRVAKHIETLRPITIKTTWLAAHALPPEYKDHADRYMQDVVIEGLKQAHAEGLIDAVDGFCETIGFSKAQIETLFIVAKALGLPVKLHAEQLSDQKGALLAARYNALSADHLEYLTEEDVERFARADTVAVLLPGAFYTLRETQLPPVEALRQNGVDIAIATDCNPGSSPISSILTIMNMACVEFSLTPEEALAGVTRCAAKALGLSDNYGTLTTGAIANLAVWDVKHPSELSYWIGAAPLHARIIQGQIV